MRRPLLILAAIGCIGAADPQVESLPVSSPLNDYNFSPDASGERAVFARSEADFANARIFEIAREDGRWGEPAPIGFTDARYSDSDPWLTPDGNTLYFVSNRPLSGTAPKADLDIWRARRTADGWSDLHHLGDINSAGPELGVEVHAGRIYFASVRKGGRGGLDIYSAPITAEGFGSVAPIGGPFNSARSDSDFTLSADGQTAIFWRSGADGRGVLHRSTRAEGAWSEPKPLPDTINRGAFNFTPSLSADGRTLWFASAGAHPGQAEGMADLFEARLR